MNREKYNEEYKGDWKKFLVDRQFNEVLVVAEEMQKRGSLSDEEMASLLVPEELCPMEHKLEYIRNVLRSLKLSDGHTWKGN